MKTIILSVIMLWISVAGFAQSTRFDKYAEVEAVDYVSISKSMLEGIPEGSNATINGIYLEGITSRLEGVQIVSTSDPQFLPKLKADYRSISKDSDYERLFYARSKETLTVTLYKSYSTRQMGELIMYIDNGESVQFVAIYGRFTSNDIKQLLRKTRK